MLKHFRHFLTNPAQSSAKPKSQAYPMTSQTKAFLQTIGRTLHERKMESADNKAEHKRRSAKFSGVL
jgi:hypothetical protein